MNFKKLVEETRTCRRFQQDPLPEGFLDNLLEIARVCPSGKNLQPLKFIVIEEQESRNKLFPHLRWAGALKDWDGPEEGERPTGYIALVLDKDISKSAGQDTGIVAQTMQLAAASTGIGCCMIGAFIKDKASEALDLEDSQDLQLILALGYPAEKRVICDVEKGNTHYYRDDEQVHYIPKRKVEDLLIKRI